MKFFARYSRLTVRSSYCSLFWSMAPSGIWCFSKFWGDNFSSTNGTGLLRTCGLGAQFWESELFCRSYIFFKWLSRLVFCSLSVFYLTNMLCIRVQSFQGKNNSILCTPDIPVYHLREWSGRKFIKLGSIGPKPRINVWERNLTNIFNRGAKPERAFPVVRFFPLRQAYKWWILEDKAASVNGNKVYFGDVLRKLWHEIEWA